jgi:signal transduction histidine kinase
VFGPLTERYRDYAQSIQTAGTHLLKILNDILDLSKIEAGRFELYEEDLVVDELFDGCRQIVADRATAAGLSLEFTPTDLELRADPLRLKQVLLNLLSNAIKFTPAGGRVMASAELTESGSLTICVRDTGIGIKPEDIERALAPFGQVHNSATRSQEGTGLGLALVCRLVELHDGRMVLESNPGHGTAVTLTFPAARTLRRSRSIAAAS